MSEIVKACAAGVSDKAGLLNAPTKHTRRLQPASCEHARHHQPGAHSSHDGTSSTRDDIAHKAGRGKHMQPVQNYLVKVVTHTCTTHVKSVPPMVPVCLNRCAVSTIFVASSLWRCERVRQKPFAGLIPVKCPLPPPLQPPPTLQNNTPCSSAVLFAPASCCTPPRAICQRNAVNVSLYVPSLSRSSGRRVRRSQAPQAAVWHVANVPLELALIGEGSSSSPCLIGMDIALVDVGKSALLPIMFTRTRYGVWNVGFGLWGLGLEFETLSFTNDVKVMPDTSTSRVTRHASRVIRQTY